MDCFLLRHPMHSNTLMSSSWDCSFASLGGHGLKLNKKGWVNLACLATGGDGFGGDLLGGGSLKGKQNGSVFNSLDELGTTAFETLNAENTPETVDFFVSDVEGDPDCPSQGFSSIDQAIDALRQGKFVIAVDDENGNEEGNLIMAASLTSTEALAFMIRYGYGSGIVSVGMKEEDLERLMLHPMSSGREREEPSAAAYTITVDLKVGISTGVSASDRAKTILALSSLDSKPEDFRRPGHVFPLMYRNGGVLRRAGHTEASVDLVLLAGLRPVSVLSAIVNEKDGSLARLHYLRKIAEQFSLPIISKTDLIRYRRKREKLVNRIAVARLPTKWGLFQAYCYSSNLDGTEHVAFVKGNMDHGQDVLVRVHSECLTGDMFGSARCDCGNQLALAMQLIEQAGRGVPVYLRDHEGRGIGLGPKLLAYNLQDQGRDTVEANLKLGLAADCREYGIGAQILRDIGVRTIHLMTNNPAKYTGLKGYGLAVVGRVPVLSPITEENRRYLETKCIKMGHIYGSNWPGPRARVVKPIVSNTGIANKEGCKD